MKDQAPKRTSKTLVSRNTSESVSRNTLSNVA